MLTDICLTEQLQCFVEQKTHGEGVKTSVVVREGVSGGGGTDIHTQ